MTNDEPQSGGPEWERNQAAKKIGRAFKTGDEPELVQGASDLSDAVVNSVISKSFKTLETTLTAIVNPLATDVRAANARADAIYAWLETEFQTNAVWRDKYSKEIDRQGEQQDAMSVALAGVGTRLGKIETDIAGLKDFQSESSEDRADIHAEIAELRTQVGELREIVVPYMASNRRAELDEALRKIALLEARLAERGQDGHS